MDSFTLQLIAKRMFLLGIIECIRLQYGDNANEGVQKAG